MSGQKTDSPLQIYRHICYVVPVNICNSAVESYLNTIQLKNYNDRVKFWHLCAFYFGLLCKYNNPLWYKLPTNTDLNKWVKGLHTQAVSDDSCSSFLLVKHLLSLASLLFIFQAKLEMRMFTGLFRTFSNTSQSKQMIPLSQIQLTDCRFNIAKCNY